MRARDKSESRGVRGTRREGAEENTRQEARSTRKKGAKEAQEATARGRNDRGTHLGLGARKRRCAERDGAHAQT